VTDRIGSFFASQYKILNRDLFLKASDQAQNLLLSKLCISFSSWKLAIIFYQNTHYQPVF